MKGYANAKILYGEDRLTKPLLRMKDGKFDKDGDFYPVSWERAFQEMEAQFKRVHAELGPSGIGVMGSGQYTIMEGYAAAKLVKAGWRSNNLDPNARHCMASAVAGFMQTFGIDEPSGCYDDIERTDAVVTWGANMAEMHPILWSRIVDARLARPEYRILNLTTYTTPTSAGSDTEILFKPNTDLAIWNYIAREILARGAMDKDFVEKHCVFAAGTVDIGFGMRPGEDHATASEKDTRERQRTVILTKEEAIGRGLDPSVTHTRAQKDAEKAGSTGSSPSRTSGKPSSPTRSSSSPRSRGRSGRAARGARAEAQGPRGPLRRSEAQGRLVLDDGLQPAHARDVGQRAGVHGSTSSRASRRSPGTAPSRSRASRPRAARRARSARSLTACPPT